MTTPPPKSLLIQALEIGEKSLHIAHTEFVHATEWCGRKIHLFSHANLPRPLAVITETALTSIPFTLATIYLPFPLFLTMVGSVIVYQVITASKDTSILTNGIGIGVLLKGGFGLSLGIATQDFNSIKTSAIQCLSGTIMLLQSGFIKRIITA